MNCKQGDLAIVVKALNPKNLGKIVRCIRFLPSHVLLDPDGVLRAHDCWGLDTVLLAWDNDPTKVILDSYLKPLRDSDGEDEMLRIVGKPVKKTERV